MNENMNNLVLFSDENVDEYVKVPCVVHMDSIKGSHAGLKDLVQRYPLLIKSVMFIEFARWWYSSRWCLLLLYTSSIF